MQSFIKQITPFFLAGIAIVALAFGLMLLAYLFLFGAMLGLGLYLFNWLKQRFFPTKTITKPEPKRTGRIIDSDDWKEL